MGKQIEALVLLGILLVGSIPVQTNIFLHLILLLIQRGSLLRLYILSKSSPDSVRRTVFDAAYKMLAIQRRDIGAWVEQQLADRV